MSITKLNKEQLLKKFHDESPKELIQLFEGLQQKLGDLGDIRETPSLMWKPEIAPIVSNYVMEAMATNIDSVDYGNETQLMESYDDAVGDVMMSVNDAHKANLQQLLENSTVEMRSAAAANQFNLNQLTPFDAFLPFVIVRSYLPLIGKDLMPTQTPPQPFVRIKQQYKYIVTSDGNRYLRPDVFMDGDATAKILASAKGPRVTEKWYPAATEVDSDEDFTEDEKKYKLPTEFKLTGVDILTESGGLAQVGDKLDLDVCVDGIRALVTASDGTKTIVTQTGYKAYPDVTSITPKRSVSFDVKIPVKDAEGKVEKYVYDRLFGDYDASTSTMALTSMYGYVRQVQFDGHLSNSTNKEFLSFTNEYGVEQHPIPEGYKSNVPITIEDMQLYNETASIDITATAVNEMTEIFTNLEDNEILNKVNAEKARWDGVKADALPFQHMFGPVVIKNEVNVKYENVGMLKRYEVVQDKINYAMRALIADIRNTLVAEPFRLVAFTHPNIAALFVGDNVDWKVTPGMQGIDGIRSDYRMGIYTSNGDSFKIISSQKVPEADGLRFLIYPINEQNFLSWKHFKYSTFFSRDYSSPVIQGVPNVLGYDRFYTHSYTPLQAQLLIKEY